MRMRDDEAAQASEISGSVPRRDVLRGSAAAALGISALTLPSAAQAFSLTVGGAAVAGVTVYWSERGTPTSANGRIGRLTYNGETTISNVDADWLTGLESPAALTTDGASLFYTSSSAGADQGIWRVSIDGTRTRVVEGEVGFFARPYIDDTHIYYFSGGKILRIAKDGSEATPVTLFEGPLNTDWQDLEVSGDTLYFTDRDNDRVMTIPKTGGVTATEFATVEKASAIDIAGGVLYAGTFVQNSSRVERFLLDGTRIGQFRASGFVNRVQIVDTVAFVATSNSTALTASGLDGGNAQTFAEIGSPIVGVNVSGLAVLP
jgi:hypothetical protein